MGGVKLIRSDEIYRIDLLDLENGISEINIMIERNKEFGYELDDIQMLNSRKSNGKYRFVQVIMSRRDETGELEEQ